MLGNPGSPLTILALGAHCDDLEIGAGGTLLRLLAEHPGSTVHWHVFASIPERATEARASAAELLANAAESHVTIHDFRDGFLPYDGAAVKERFELIKREVRPDLVLTHRTRDVHQDHRTVGELTWNTFRDHLILEFEIPKYEGDLGHPNVFVPLDHATAARKVDLILRHFPSQQGHRWFSASTFEALMRLRGIECNAPDGLAEGLYARKVVISAPAVEGER